MSEFSGQVRFFGSVKFWLQTESKWLKGNCFLARRDARATKVAGLWSLCQLSVYIF